MIEVMVAVLLLLVLAAGLVPVFLTGLSQSSATRYKSLATNIAREKMEQIRRLDYREISEANLYASFGSTAEVDGIQFTIAYSVPEEPPEPEPKLVTVTVTWKAPPKPSPAVLTTLIHQQFVGPRGALLTFSPTYTDEEAGTPTPFSRLSGLTTAEYRVAQIDWGLVLDKLDQPDMSKKNVYMRLFLVDDAGIKWQLGPSDNDYKIDTSYLQYELDGAGKVKGVYFSYNFYASAIPDGYWNAKAVIYNEHNEPGNVWTLRIRINEHRPPGTPAVTAQGQEDNQSVIVTWTPGDERDRAYWVIERDKKVDGEWQEAGPPLETDWPSGLHKYTDQGNVAAQSDPWGTTDTTNYYRYRVWAVDKDGLVGEPGSADAELPPATTTTTISTTTTTSGTTTTTGAGSTTTTVPPKVKVQNTTNKQWDIVIRDASENTVEEGTVKNGDTWTSKNLAAGNYTVTATYGDEKPRTAGFNIPNQSDITVLVIAWD